MGPRAHDVPYGDGVSDVAGILDELKPQRIEHGVRSAESAATTARLVNDAVALDVCPLSNVKLCVPGIGSLALEAATRVESFGLKNARVAWADALSSAAPPGPCRSQSRGERGLDHQTACTTGRISDPGGAHLPRLRSSGSTPSPNQYASSRCG